MGFSDTSGETLEELLADITEKHGERIADIVLRFIFDESIEDEPEEETLAV